MKKSDPRNECSNGNWVKLQMRQLQWQLENRNYGNRWHFEEDLLLQDSTELRERAHTHCRDSIETHFHVVQNVGSQCVLVCFGLFEVSSRYLHPLSTCTPHLSFCRRAKAWHLESFSPNGEELDIGTTMGWEARWESHVILLCASVVFGVGMGVGGPWPLNARKRDCFGFGMGEFR